MSIALPLFNLMFLAVRVGDLQVSSLSPCPAQTNKKPGGIQAELVLVLSVKDSKSLRVKNVVKML